MALPLSSWLPSCGQFNLSGVHEGITLGYMISSLPSCVFLIFFSFEGVQRGAQIN